PEEYQHSWPAVVKERKGKVQPQKLWGYRFQIESRPQELFEDDGGPLSGGDGPPQVRINVNPSIDGERANREARPGASHQEIPGMLPEGVGAELCFDGPEIRDTLALEDPSSTLIYLFCHGEQERALDGWSRELLMVDEGVEVTPDTVDTKLPLEKAPIVVLNSCSSGAFSPLKFDTFLTVFEERGACGLLTTSFPVPTHFAAAFGRELLVAYARGKETIGEIVHRLRRTLLERGNPLGLLYSVQCPLEAKAPAVPGAAAGSEAGLGQDGTPARGHSSGGSTRSIA
ncbi:MAG: C25 family cysteine peptidase, partial [Holophagales bacterium]|nr:C25 family cysteine peptidase [Holophagales bacterium]